MSVNFFTDTIAAATTNITAKVASGHEKFQSNDYNSMSKLVATQALMDNRRYQHHQEQQGSQGTPDANIYASNMSSDSINNSNINNNQEQQQHVNTSNNTSQAVSLCGPSAQDLFSHLHEALALEPKYQPNLFLPQQSNVSVYFNITLFSTLYVAIVCELRFFFVKWVHCLGF